MAVLRDRALLLKRSVFGESSLVAHVLTPGAGRVELIAKGALSIRRGDGPWLTARKLEAFLSYKLRNKKVNISSRPHGPMKGCSYTTNN